MHTFILTRILFYRQMISQLSKSAQSDVEKGQHVRQQLVRLYRRFGFKVLMI